MDYGHMNYGLFFVYTLPPHFGHSPHLADSGECLTSLTAVKLLLHPKSLVNQRPRMLFSAFSAMAVKARPQNGRTVQDRNCKLQCMYNHAGCFVLA
jgi:hypothetical protein